MSRMSKTERISRERIISYLYAEQMRDNDLSLELRGKVPDAWHTLEHDLDVEEPKIKITLRLDASVAKFYRGMGQGYQARISRILGLWAHMKSATSCDWKKRCTHNWPRGTPRIAKPRRGVSGVGITDI